LKKLLYIFLFLLVLPIKSFAEAYAFPGAVGFGAKVRGAYAGANSPEVCIVNTLTWSTGDPTWDNSTYNFGVYKGSLGQCLALDVEAGETVDGHAISADSGLIIVFEVGGTINRGGGYINIIYDNISIFGESAPAPGITIRSGILNVSNASDIIIKHLKLRVGEQDWGDTPGSCSNADSLSVYQSTAGQTARIMLDHISASWGCDETVQIYSDDGDIYDVTLSNFIISESLEYNVCHENLQRGYALLLSNVARLTIYKGLLAHNQGRTPWFDEHDEIQVWDVVGFNTNVDPLKISDNGTDYPDMSLREIFYRKGSESNANYGDYAVKWQSSLTSDADIYHNNLVCYNDSNDYSAYASPATDCAYDQATSDPSNGSDTVSYGSGSYYVAPTIKNIINGQNSAHEDYWLSDIGARPAERDSSNDTIDKCVVDSYHGTGRRTDGLYIDSEMDSNGCGMASTYWPSASDSHSLSAMPSNPHETQASGYTSLEEWIHENYTAIVEGAYVGAETPEAIKGLHLY
jgi:hypothetical protein